MTAMMTAMMTMTLGADHVSFLAWSAVTAALMLAASAAYRAYGRRRSGAADPARGS